MYGCKYQSQCPIKQKGLSFCTVFSYEKCVALLINYIKKEEIARHQLSTTPTDREIE